MRLYQKQLMALLLAPLLSANAADQNMPAQEQQKAQLVSRLYQATYGAEKRCAPLPEASASLEKTLRMFRSKFPELTQLVGASPYFAVAKDNFQQFLDDPKQKVGNDMLLKECQGLESMVRMLTEAPGGDEAVAEYVQLLRK